MSLPRVAIIGGGLAGMAAAVALEDAPCEVHLFEARRQLGGRAASYRDPATGAQVDFCQHVSMGCCTELARFCRQTGIADQFERHRTLYFIGPDGSRSDLSAVRWLPPPLHLAPALLRLKFISLADRLRVARGLLALRSTRVNVRHEPTMLAWLQSHGQSEQAIERFWSVVLVSALGDTLDRVSLSSGRKVFVDGFMQSRDGYEVQVPKRPLSELFDEQVGRHLNEHQVTIHRGTPVKIDRRGNKFLVESREENFGPFDFAIVTVPWRLLADAIGPVLSPALPCLETVRQFESSPITGVHLWFDRPITDLPHAVLVGRLSQWLFSRGEQPLEDGRPAHYYQVVISASRNLTNYDRPEIARRVHEDLAEVFRAARTVTLCHSKVVTDPHAVFTTAPALDLRRPAQLTTVPNLFLAGDWTATGWPATMEGAVRSGNQAAQELRARLAAPR